MRKKYYSLDVVYTIYYYIASSVSGHAELNLLCDWLPEQERRTVVSCPFEITHYTRKIIFFSKQKWKPYNNKNNPLLTTLVVKWVVVLVLFCVYMDLNFVLVHKHAKRELGQYPAILTSCLVNNPYVLVGVQYLPKHMKWKPVHRVRTCPGKPRKSWNFIIIAFFSTGKSWRKAIGPGKFWKSV